MSSSLPLPRIRFVFPVASALLPTLLGCASPGQPHAPSLHLPAPVTALQAERIGPAVHLTWTTPDTSTDGQTLRGPVVALLCRDSVTAAQPVQPVPAVQPVPGCVRVGSVPVVPGASTAEDLLPPRLLSGPATLLSYHVQLFNAAGHAAGPSAPVYAVAGAAPAPLGPIHVSATGQGAEISWTPGGDGAAVELKRTLIASAPQPTSKPASGSAPAPGRQAPFQSGVAGPGKVLGQNPPVEVTLRARKGSHDQPVTSSDEVHKSGGQRELQGLQDSGGLLDPGVRPLSTYRYVGQRVRTVSFPAPAGASAGQAVTGPGGRLVLQMRGLASPPAEFTYRDTFPPPSPSGLAAIASPGDPSDATHPAAVDLSWDPGSAADLLGYNVYRADTPGGSFHRLNASPLAGPAFHDPDVAPGRSYLYRVTAVDRTGNESQPSPPLPQTVPRS